MVGDVDLRHRPEKAAGASRAKAKDDRRHDGNEARTNDSRDPALSRHDREAAIGGLDQPPRERDALGLVGIEDRRAGLALEHGRELPREIHGVTDAGVHPLAAHRTVDVGGVAEEEGSAVAEARRHAMVDTVRREPVHPGVRELHPIHRSALDVVERDRVIGLLASVHEAHQAQVSGTLQREDQEEIRVLDVDVQLIVDDGTARLNVGDIEVSLIGAAREFDAELVPDGR